MNTKDLYVKYGVVLRKRKTWNQKIRFLSTLEKEFQAMGFETALMKKDYKSKRSLSLYVNNLNTAKHIYATTYDNPIVSPLSYHPFNNKSSKKRLLVGSLLPFLSIIMIAGCVITYFMNHSWHQNPLGIKSFGGYAILVLLLWLISKINQGISKRNVLFNNTSSIIELIKFAKKHPEYGYVFTDFGNQDSFGYLCLRDYLTDKDKKITFVDTIGNDKDNILKLSHEALKDCILTDWFTHPEFLTSGRLKDGKVYQDTQVGSYENDEDLIIQA